MIAPASCIPAGDDARVPERRQRRIVDAHFWGRLSPAGERRMRLHLVTCGLCRAYYDRHLLLGKADPSVARPMRDRLADGLGLSPGASQPAGRARRVIFAAGAIAVACALVLLIGPRDRSGPESRGAVPGSQLLVYELAAGEPPRRVVSQIHADAELAFAYANIGHKRRLMVFAVDEDRRVYWYHPARPSQTDDPTALEIAGDDAIHEIPQAITHHFAGRRVELFGVFLDQAMSARGMEDLVIHAPADGEGRLQLRIPGADLTRLTLELVARP